MAVRKRPITAKYLLLFFIVCAALCSCNSAAQDQKSTITIEFWTIALGDAFADYINGMIATYESEHPGIEIKWVDVSGAEVAEKFLAALVGKAPPDLVNIYDLPRFLQFGVLADMDSLVSDIEKTKRLENFWHGVGYYQGRNYVIPWYAGVYMMWYNSALFTAAGLDPNQPPQSIDEMLEMGRVIHEKTGKYGISWRLHPSLGAPAWALLRLDGVWPLFDTDYRRTTINTPGAHAVLQKWIDAYQNGTLPPEALASSHRDDVNWFIEGRAAMLPFSGGWITRYFDPSFADKAVAAAQPRGVAGLVPATNQALVVPRMSPHIKEAVDFGLFITNDVNQLEFCRQVAILPSTKEAANDPYFRREPKTLADRANQFSATDLKDSFVLAPPDVKGWSRMEDILYEEFSKAMAGQQSAQEALARVEKKWNQLLEHQ
ncbi:MAG: ABC transporter substrate-binding protein [Candidatus Latescibacterota bacterium]